MTRPSSSDTAARIRQAREYLQLTPEQVASQLGIEAGEQLKIEAGKSEPAAALLYRYATLLHRPLDYFLGAQEDLNVAAHLAGNLPQPSPGALIALLHFEALCLDLAALEALAETKTPIQLEGKTALDVRRQLRLDNSAPIRGVRGQLEDFGVFAFVLHGPGVPNMAIHDHRFGSCVLLSAALVAEEMSFELARVVGTLLQASDPFVFAVELLMPDEGLRGRVTSLVPSGIVSPADFAYLAAIYGVPRAVLRKRLADLGFSTSREEPPPLLPTSPAWTSLPTRFLYLASRAYLAGHFTRARLAELLRVDLEQLPRDLR